MKRAIALTVFIFLCAPLLKADSDLTWDFAFVSSSGDFTGSGSFTTLPSSITDPLYGDPVVSLDGVLNGQPMTLIPAQEDALYVPFPDNPGLGATFDPGALLFSVDGMDYSVYYFDLPDPPFGPGNVIQTGLKGSGRAESIDLTLVANTPEPSTLLLLALGLAGLGIGTLKFAKRARIQCEAMN